MGVRSDVSEFCYTYSMDLYQYDQALISFSRSNRKKQTDSERLLWFHLRQRLQGYKFRRQYPVNNFILDFYCVQKKLAIELDGSQHLQNRSYDNFRSGKLAKLGIKILRFWDNEVHKNIRGVLEKILIELEKPHPSLLLRGEGK